MSRRIKVTAIPKQDPMVRLYVLALIGLARQMQEQEEQERTNGQPEPIADEEAGK